MGLFLRSRAPGRRRHRKNTLSQICLAGGSLSAASIHCIVLFKQLPDKFVQGRAPDFHGMDLVGVFFERIRNLQLV